MKKAKSALISVFHKDGLEPIAKKLHADGVTIYSTGGTQDFLNSIGIPVIPVEDLTTYPSILGGRVKTLHPKVFGGILGRREVEKDRQQMAQYEIPEIDIVIVDLYPFEKTLASGASHEDIIEKIDIGGISLIRAAAKNYQDVVIVPSMEDYSEFLRIITENNSATTLKDREYFAMRAFAVSSEYDSAICGYFASLTGKQKPLRIAIDKQNHLRYGENPHQKGVYYGDLESMFTQLHGKELSYNNLLDVDSAVNLMSEFLNDEPTFAILKHNNACGVATRSTTKEAYKAAFAGDPVSAYGGVVICNRPIDAETAAEMNSLFMEVIIAPGYDEKALEILESKKNRIILVQKKYDLQPMQIRTLLNGVLCQERNTKTDHKEDLKNVTEKAPSDKQIDDLLFASKICKHTKSNAMVLAKGKQLIASGVGQTSRIDALKQAIEKAKNFGFDLQGAVLASDAFFPFSDNVETAHAAGIEAIIQPGGSIRDQESIDCCNKNGVAMVFTGTRHFKH